MQCNAETKSFVFTKAELKALMAFTSDDDTRPQLSSVFFDPKNGCAVTTDGASLARVKNSVSFKGMSFLVHRIDLERLQKSMGAKDSCTICFCPGKKGKKGKKDGVKLIVNPLGLEGGPGTTEATVAPVDASFPQYEKIIPSVNSFKATATPIGFDTSYLALLLPIGKLCSERTCGVKCYFAGELDPALFVALDVERSCEWNVVIMPMRV